MLSSQPLGSPTPPDRDFVVSKDPVSAPSLVYAKSDLFEVEVVASTETIEAAETHGVPILLDSVSLSTFLGLTHQQLWHLSTSKNGRYKSFKLPKGINKKTGKMKFRYLSVPDKQLKDVQKLITSNLLNHCQLPDYITGFRPGTSIRDTGERHAGKKTVISLDIQNFFPSIKEYHVRRVMREMFGYPPDVSRILSELCTVGNFVPQGAPTSPALSNVVGYFFFDKEVKEIADEHGWEYTRYADDLTFSTDTDYPKIELDLPNGKTKITSDIDPIIERIAKACKKHGFYINQSKTKVMRDGSRKWVLGQVVNVEPNVLRSRMQTLRAILHNMASNDFQEEAAKTGRTVKEFLQWVKGCLAFVKQINPVKGEAMLDEFKLILESREYKPDDIEEIELLAEDDLP